MPIKRQSEYFLNTILNDSESTESNFESDNSESTENDSESSCSESLNHENTCIQSSMTDNDFIRAYNNLYTRWINLHRS